MATGVAAVSGATAIPGVGWIIGLGAAYIDAAFVMPKLAGKPRGDALPPELLGVDVSPNEAGAPRIWAIGGTVRVPTHVMWQSRKVRETTTTHRKAGMSGPSALQREVMIDALLSLNDRKTVELTQLIGNGKLLLWESRNLVRLTTHEMTAAVSGADVVVTMSNTLVPSPTDVFKVGDFVRLYGWVSTAGPTINGHYWRVSAITGHTSTPGTITLQVVDGQTVTGVAANGGSAFTPAHIERVDDALLGDPATTLGAIGGPAPGSGSPPNARIVTITFPAIPDTRRVFNVGDKVKLTHVWFNTPPSGPNREIPSYIECDVLGVSGSSIEVGPTPEPPTNEWPTLNTQVINFQATNDWPRIEFATATTAATPFFEPGFVPKEHYHDGSEDQGEDAILVAELGTGNVSAYRGMAYQAIDGMRCSQFGEQLPFSIEAIIRPDASMTWAQAVRAVLVRCGIASNYIDTDGISSRPFLGYFIRGFVPTATVIQPLLLAGHLLPQERDGTIAFFQIENADVTQIENGPAFSDLGAHPYGEARADRKIAVSDDAEEDLPTSVGVRHQDADNVYANGYQTFGLRNPNGVSHENRNEINLSTMVLSRKEAKNLATTAVRRAWINNRKYGIELTACYIDQLENDVLTVTDDDGNDIVGRIAQRDLGGNFLVKCTLVREDLRPAVVGSPVQSAAGLAPPSIITPAVLDVAILDIPSLQDSENNVPGLRFAACAQPGSRWAGARLFESTDGSNFSPAEPIGEQSVMGFLQESTPSVAGSSETYGSATVTFYTAPVDVEFTFDGGAGVNSCSQADALVGRNLCAIVDADTGEVELAAFTSATLIGTRTYTLDGWLRGLRGTKTNVKAAGSRLVILGPAAEYPSTFRTYPGLSQPTALSFKVVPAGQSIDNVSAVQVVATWRNTRPLPVRRIVKTIGGSPFDARFEVENWTRQHLPLGALPPYVMDELYEGYKLTIWNPAGTIIRRIKTIQASPGMGTQTLRDRWFDYPASEQTADGYTPSASTTFTIDVQQFGAFGSTFGLSDSVKQVI